MMFQRDGIHIKTELVQKKRKLESRKDQRETNDSGHINVTQFHFSLN